MSGRTYLGTERIKKWWIDDREVKKVFLGTDNVYASEMEYSYTGVSELVGDPEGDWMLYLKTSGTLLIDFFDPVDVFMVGRGKNGSSGIAGWGSGYNTGANPAGGNAGDGGKCLQNTDGILLPITAIDVVIGGEVQEETSLGTLLNTHDGIVYGIGGLNGVRSNNKRGPAGTDGFLAFDGNYYGGGGSAGSSYRTYNSSGTVNSYDPGRGSLGLGGRASAIGSGPNPTAGSYGGDNTGGGAGGGAGVSWFVVGSHPTTSGGIGGTGVIILRNHRLEVA